MESKGDNDTWKHNPELEILLDTFEPFFQNFCIFFTFSKYLNFSFQPDFASHPIDSDEKVNEWLKFYEMSAPLVCLGMLISSDPVSRS